MSSLRISVRTLVLVAAAACSFAGQAHDPLKSVKIRMDWVPSGIYAGFYHAQAKGFYAREGLNVEILPGNGSNATMDGMLRGDTEFGFVTCWAAAIGISKGRSIALVSTYAAQNGYPFFTPKAANVGSLKDLAGKAIVVTPSGFDTQLFPAVFAGNGLPTDSLKTLNVDPSQKIRHTSGARPMSWSLPSPTPTR